MKYLFVILTFIMALVSCEENINDYDLPYEKKLVVRCILEAGKPVDYINISKTIPPLEEATQDKIALDSVSGFITDGENKYNIVKKDIITYEAQGLIPEAGKEYHLEITADNMKVHASTHVPHTPVTESIFYKITESEDNWYDWLIEYFVKIDPETDCAYTSVLIKDYGNGHKVSYLSNSSTKYSDTTLNGYLNLSFQEHYTDDTTNIQGFEDYTLGIISYDSDFFDYFRTKYNSELDWEFFGSSGTNVIWNIKGDGIGLFLGKNIIEMEL